MGFSIGRPADELRVFAKSSKTHLGYSTDSVALLSVMLQVLAFELLSLLDKVKYPTSVLKSLIFEYGNVTIMQIDQGLDRKRSSAKRSKIGL